MPNDSGRPSFVDLLLGDLFAEEQVSTETLGESVARKRLVHDFDKANGRPCPPTCFCDRTPVAEVVDLAERRAS